mgnify:CR=1 FL=1
MREVVMNEKTNLLQLEEHFYQLVDVEEPNVFRNLFPYEEIPKIAFNDRIVPHNMPDGALNKNNSVNYKNDRIVELMNRVKHITDEQERQNIFDEIQEIAVEEQPVVPLFNDMAIVATNKRLKNYGAINQIELASDYN